MAAHPEIHPPSPRVLLCVSGIDAAVIENLLVSVEARGVVFSDPEEIARQTPWDADAILISEEMLDEEGLELLIETLNRQPQWSDLPVLLVSEGPESPIAQRAMQALTNVLLLDRPVQLSTLSSALRMILRARSRQHRLRELHEELHKSEERFREMFEYAPVGMTLNTLDGRFIHVNDAYCRMTGYSREELFSEALTFQKLTHPDDIGENMAALDCLLAGEIPAVFLEKRYIRSDRKIIWVQASFTLRRDIGGNTTHIIVIIEDITNRKKVEAQLREARKMEAIGRLAAGVAHEFNNMLNIIHGNAELLGLQLGKESPNFKYILEITDAAQRSATLSDQLLAYACKQVSTPENIDLNCEIGERLNMLESLSGKSIDIHFHPRESVWPVRVDLDQLEQILVNLAENAADAIPDTGSVTITTDNVRLDGSVAEVDLPPGDYVKLSFSDTGAGMDREIRERIFDPFFTTRDVGEGTGLGLSTTLGIIKQNNGGITVESEPGKGSTFHLFFPRSDTEIDSVIG